MGELLKRRVGPLPMWIWFIVFIVLLGAVLIYRKKKATAAAAAAAQQQAGSTSSNLGTVPVSNLTTTAQPMPVQLGDTFVNTTIPNTTNTTINNQPPSYTLQTAPPPSPSPAVLLAIGQAQQQQETQAAGGNPLVAMKNLGLTPSDVKALAAAVAAGGANWLTENMVAKEAGLPQVGSQ